MIKAVHCIFLVFIASALADVDDGEQVGEERRRRKWTPPTPAPIPVPPPPQPPAPAPPPPVDPTPQPTPMGPGTGPWDVVEPSFVGLSKAALDEAKEYINDNILQRQCFLLIKDGKIAYEWYDPQAPDPPMAPPWHGLPQDKPHRGWSMTKTIGGFLVLLAATEDGLNIDADITKAWGIKSPKPYPVTLRMMMAQVTGGDHQPGEKWRYDEMGDMWLHIFPSIIQAATGHQASYYFERLHSRLGLSDSFAWDSVNSKWFRGATGSCRDWARFGQLILNKGMWAGQPLISSDLIAQMQKPVKYAPYTSYANPCYGLLIWVNADKSKTPGCCWEASRLPPPDCGRETFMTGAVHDLTLNIGLYGQLVMTLASVQTVVVGFGNDLRPIEPARIGYYPGVCKALGIPCNRPPTVPKTRCGEVLACTGVAAQCFSGGKWAHVQPYPGKEQCVQCFQNRLPSYLKKFPEAHDMVTKCPHQSSGLSFDFMKCFCGLTGINANPFNPWPNPNPPEPRAGGGWGSRRRAPQHATTTTTTAGGGWGTRRRVPQQFPSGNATTQPQRDGRGDEDRDEYGDEQWTSTSELVV